MKEAYPHAEAIVRERSPAGAKDWNDALRTTFERVEGQIQGQENDRTLHRSRGYRVHDEPSRD